MENFRTDLADERRDLFRKANHLENEIPGIEAEEVQKSKYIKLNKVRILNEEGANAIGKPIGNYITFDLKYLNVAGDEEIQSAAEALSEELKTLIESKVKKADDILIVGLGNEKVTPDSLGPRVISKIDVTRHWFTYMPQLTDENTRPVSAVSPGVLGTTGIETQEILKGIVENVKPKLIVVIDALASKSMERISSTIQLADTGIVPGAGVGNRRQELSEKTLGIPVIAIGVPTVVEAATVAADSLTIFIKKLQEEAKSNKFLNELNEENKYEMIKEVLQPNDFNFIVTPKEIDDLILNMSSVVARGINMSL